MTKPTSNEPTRRERRKLNFIVRRARRLGHIANGLVLCDNCDSPADREGSLALSWTGCHTCIWGEADGIGDDPIEDAII